MYTVALSPPDYCTATHRGGKLFAFAGVPRTALTRAKRVRGGRRAGREVVLLQSVAVP